MDGIINLFKPAGITSHTAVQRISRKAGVKVGHTGTLDPAASGVLLLCLGKATRLAPFFNDYSKEYVATLRLGVTTSTDDAAGEVLEQRPTDNLSEVEVRAVFSRFIGEIAQRPPDYAAVHFQGERLYKLARRGEKVEPPPRSVFIEELTIQGCVLPYVTFRVRCSKGTYIRSLCRDIGMALQVGGHLSALVRTRVGNYCLSAAQPLSNLISKASIQAALQPWQEVLPEIPALVLAKDDIISLVYGRSIPLTQLTTLKKSLESASYYRVFDVAGRFWAMGKTELTTEENAVLRPERVFTDSRDRNLVDRLTNGYSVCGDQKKEVTG